jgi:myo-inositol-1-phosphate synthase
MSEYMEKNVHVNLDSSVEIIENTYDFMLIPPNKKIGVMIVGLGGNNGVTFTISVLANQLNKQWKNKNGIHTPSFFGSLSQYGSVHIGYDENKKSHSKLYKEMLQMCDINDIIISGWDIVKDDLHTASERQKVVDSDLRDQLKSKLEKIVPLPSIYYPNFIAKNQENRVNNILTFKHKKDDLMYIIKQIEDFKFTNRLEQVIVLWSGSTERFNTGNWKNWSELMRSIENDDPEVSPSIIFAMAAISCNCIFLNGSPQNTLIPAVIEYAEMKGSFVGGEDLKTGQTKLKSVIADFLVSSGIKPLSITSYNHLGNNDGKNLDEYPQFRSKEITKKSVIDDLVESNPILFKDGPPDHCVVIKYVPSVGDSKRAIDEYYSEICLDGRHTLSIINTCEDSLLASALILDIILFSDLLSRIKVSKNGDTFKSLSHVLSFLSFFFKSPVVNNTEPIINCFFNQKYGLENLFRVLNDLPPIDFINLSKKI